MEEALTNLPRARSDDCQVGVEVCEVHVCQLVSLVLGRVLNDAKGVEPKVLEAKCAGDTDRVKKGLGETRGVYPVCVGGYVGFGGLMRLVLAPDVAEGEIPAALTTCLHETRTVGIGAVEEAGREGRDQRAGEFDAMLVATCALVKTLFRERQSARRPNVQDRASHDDGRSCWVI